MLYNFTKPFLKKAPFQNTNKYSGKHALIKSESFDSRTSSEFWDERGFQKITEVLKNTKLIGIVLIFLPDNHFSAFQLLLFDFKKSLMMQI